MLNESWKTDGLPDKNAYTVSIILPALNLLGVGPENDKVREGINTLIEKINAQGGITLTPETKGTKSAFITWWAVRTLSEYLKVQQDEDEKAKYQQAISRAIDWAKREVYRQISFFTADWSDLRNIHQLAFSWSICSVFGKEFPLPPEISNLVLNKIFEAQEASSGVWKRYFPLFNFEKAGAAYVYHFELLLALVYAIEENPLILLPYLDNLKKIVGWVETRKIYHRETATEGWSIDSDPIVRFQPISWATAEVLYVLHRLDETLGIIHRELVFNQLTGDSVPQGSAYKSLDTIIDMKVETDGTTRTVVELIKEELINPIIANGKTTKGINDSAVLSVFLFGPPGTSKTSIAQGIAKELDWPLLEIDPSNFAPRNDAGLEMRVLEVFSYLENIFDTVILLDEMDELVRDRSNDNNTDRIGRLWTTLMLPRLTRLRKRARCVVVGATNYIDHIDDAAKRPGRFDMVLPAGPPIKDGKLREIARRIQEEEETLHGWYSNLDVRCVTCFENLLFNEIGWLIKAMDGAFNQDSFKEAVKAIDQRIYLHQKTNKGEKNWDSFDRDCKSSTRLP